MSNNGAVFSACTETPRILIVAPDIAFQAAAIIARGRTYYPYVVTLKMKSYSTFPPFSHRRGRNTAALVLFDDTKYVMECSSVLYHGTVQSCNTAPYNCTMFIPSGTKALKKKFRSVIDLALLVPYIECGSGLPRNNVVAVA